MKKIAFFGTGKIGTYYLAHLARAASDGKIEVWVFCTPRHLEILNIEVIARDLKGNEIRCPRIDGSKVNYHLVDNSKEWPNLPSFDYIIDATNVGTWTKKQIKKMAGLLSDKGLYMALVNGLPFSFYKHHSKTFAPADPTGALYDNFIDNCIIAVVHAAVGFNKNGEDQDILGRAILKGSPKLEIGLPGEEDDPRLNFLAKIINDYGTRLDSKCVVRYRDDNHSDGQKFGIMTYVVMKWVGNFIYNALATIHGSGKVGVKLCDLKTTLEAKDLDFFVISDSVGQELFNAVQSEGYNLKPISFRRRAENALKMGHIPSTAVAVLEFGKEPEKVIFDSAAKIISSGDIGTLEILNQFNDVLGQKGLLR